MIKLNGRDFPWEQNMTVRTLLEAKKYIYVRIIVKVNDELILPEHYDTARIHNGDDVKIIHLLAGG